MLVFTIELPREDFKDSSTLACFPKDFKINVLNHNLKKTIRIPASQDRKYKVHVKKIKHRAQQLFNNNPW